MAALLSPYLSFKNKARQAMEFYTSVFGGDLGLVTFKDFQAAQDPNEENLVMHSVLEFDVAALWRAARRPDLNTKNQLVSVLCSVAKAPMKLNLEIILTNWPPAA